MNRHEKKIKQQMEHALYPHFHENFEALRGRLPDKEKVRQTNSRRRRLPMAVSGAIALAAVMLAWVVYRKGFEIIPTDPTPSSAVSTQTNTVSSTGTQPSQTGTSGETKGTTSGTGIYYEKSSIEDAESKMQMLFPGLSSFGIKEYELAMREGEPIAFRYVLDSGYVEIRKQPLKTAGLNPITVDNHQAYLDSGVDYIRLMADDNQLFYDIYLQQADGRIAAEEIIAVLFNFY